MILGFFCDFIMSQKANGHVNINEICINLNNVITIYHFINYYLYYDTTRTT